MDREAKNKQILDAVKQKYTPEGAGPAGDDYDPYDHRVVTRGTNYAETLIHVLKASIGTGILAMPEAFKHSGIVLGIIFTIFIGWLCAYGITLLYRTQYGMCKKLKVPYLTYTDTVRSVLLVGPPSLYCAAVPLAVIVDVFLVVYQTGVCCVYVIFVAANLKEVIDPSLSEPVSIRIYIIFLVIPVALVFAIPYIKWLAPLSLVSNIFILIAFFILLYHIFLDIPSLEGRYFFGQISEFPLYIGTTLFALAAIGCIISVEKNMTNPGQLRGSFGVLTVSMIVIVAVYTVLGLFGYWTYGGKTQPSVSLNIDPSYVTAKIVQGLFAAAVFFSYPLNGYAPVDILWNDYLVKHLESIANHWVWEYIIRALIVIISFTLGANIPLFGDFISLFGAFCMSTLQVIYPALMNICMKYEEGYGFWRWILIKDIFIMFVGFVGMFSGTYSSILSIIRHLQEETI